MAHSNTLTTLIRSISEQTGVPQAKVKAIVCEFLETTACAVSQGDRVVLRGFGTFFKKIRKQRKYRDFRTGEIKDCSPAPIPSFQPSRVLVREINQGRNASVRAKRVETIPGDSNVIALKPHRVPNAEIDKTELCEVIVSTPNPRQEDTLTIRYRPTSAFDSPNTYPVVYSPAPNAFIKLPRDGRSDIRGYKEADFLNEINAEFSDISISDSFHLKIPGRYAPYEPDIVLYDETLNLYIDVEIDEPYNGYSRLVTHIIEGKDAIRDTFFKESGWIVVRFSERQVHLYCNQCIKTLRNIVDTMRGKDRPAPPLVEEESRWDRNQAIQWEKELYREKYLGIQFFSKQIRTRKIQCVDGVEGIDRVIERTPAHLPSKAESQVLFPDYPVGLSLNSTAGTHTHDPRTRDVSGFSRTIPLSQTHPPLLSFIEETHSYSAPGDDTGNTDRVSVTTLIEEFFPHFDEEAYIKKRMEETGMSEEAVRRELAEPSERGTDMHKQIENFLKGLPYDDSSIEFQHFLKFYQEQIVKRGLVFDSAEYAIELKGSNIAGTVDALFRKPNGEFVMVDWKRSKHLIIDGYPKKYGFGRGLSVLSHLDNSSYYKYEIQQSFYKFILEKDYGIKVSSMILAVLYPDYDRYYSIRLSEYREKEVIDMIESYENIL